MNPPIKDLRVHWEKCRKTGKPLEAAIVIGPVPAVGYCSAVRFPYEVDELAVSGGIAGEPIDLVKCRTVDLEVPATAEIVIEGLLPTDSMEREGPFGEFTGYMAPEVIGPYFNITCITHRKNPIFNVFISQFPPSESSTMRCVGEEANLYKFLRYDCGLPVVDVAISGRVQCSTLYRCQHEKDPSESGLAGSQWIGHRFYGPQSCNRRGRRYRPPQPRFRELGHCLASPAGSGCADH